MDQGRGMDHIREIMALLSKNSSWVGRLFQLIKFEFSKTNSRRNKMLRFQQITSECDFESAAIIFFFGFLGWNRNQKWFTGARLIFSCFQSSFHVTCRGFKCLVVYLGYAPATTIHPHDFAHQLPPPRPFVVRSRAARANTFQRQIVCVPPLFVQPREDAGPRDHPPCNPKRPPICRSQQRRSTTAGNAVKYATRRCPPLMRAPLHHHFGLIVVARCPRFTPRGRSGCPTTRRVIT